MKLHGSLFLQCGRGHSPARSVSDCSGYFFAKQKSLSGKRAAAGLPAAERPKKSKCVEEAFQSASANAKRQAIGRRVTFLCADGWGNCGFGGS